MKVPRDFNASKRTTEIYDAMKPKVAFFMPEEIAATVISEKTKQAIRSEADLIERSFSKWDTSEELGLDTLAEVDYLFTSWSSPAIDEATLTACPNLKAVFHCAGSVNAYTSDAFWESEIPITSAYHANSIPVAEFTYSQIVLSLKGYWQSFSEYKANREIPYDRKDVIGTKGSTVGLISFGSIARLLLNKLNALDINVVAYDPYLSKEDMALHGVKKVELMELFETSNVASCHAPLTEETVGLIGEDHLAAMPTKGTFINTARGKIVDSAGMVAALKKRPDVAALLDVTYPEPLTKEDPIFDLPNAFVSAHIAGSVGNECQNLGEAMLKEFKRFLAGQGLEWEITHKHALMMT